MRKGPEYLVSPEKRSLDIVGALALGGIALPVCTASAVLLSRELGVSLSDALFRQKRRGPGGPLFDVLKLRTLPVADGQPLTIHGTYDPRAGAIGRQVRRLGLDEIPQFVNVLRGEMSLVGPRPVVEDTFGRFEEADPSLFNEWSAMYKETRPGLCGPSQVMHRRHTEITPQVRADSMRVDLLYAQTASLGGDLLILATTPAGLIRASAQAVRDVTPTV